MERVPVTQKSRPLSEIKLTHVSTYFSYHHRALRFGGPCGDVSDFVTLIALLQVTIHANPIADAEIAGR